MTEIRLTSEQEDAVVVACLQDVANYVATNTDEGGVVIDDPQLRQAIDKVLEYFMSPKAYKEWLASKWEKKEEITRAAHFHLWECTWCKQ